MAFGAGWGDKGSRSHATRGERVNLGGWKESGMAAIRDGLGSARCRTGVPMNIARMLLLSMLLHGSIRMTTEAATTAALMSCTAPEHRQFDFWIGEWDVFGGPEGDRLVGNNTIERSENGCWLVERWRGASGNH